MILFRSEHRIFLTILYLQIDLTLSDF